MSFTNLDRVITSVALLTLVLGFYSGLAYAQSGGKVVFYYAKDSKSGNAVVRLDRLQPVSEGVRAILAMYAFQNGSDCMRGERHTCALTDALELGEQCSEQHVEFVRKWFREEMPQMSGFAPSSYKGLKSNDRLAELCYQKTGGETFQEIWDLIRVTVSGNRVHVYANGMWLARENSGKLRYETDYLILQDSIQIISHRDVSPKSVK